MDKDEKKGIVDKLTDEHRKTLKEWADEAGKDVKELVNLFCEMYAKDETEEAYGDDEQARIRYSMNVIKGRLGNEMSTPTEEVEIYVLGISSPSTIERDDGSKTQVGSAFGLGEIESYDELKELDISGWDEEAELVEELEHGKSYKMNVSRRGSADAQKVQYNIESHTEVEETDFDPSNVPKLLKNFFPKVELAHTGEHISKDRNDRKMVRGIIENINFFRTNDGRQMARVEIMDNSVALKDVSETGLFSIIMPIDMCQFGPDSDVCFVGRITMDEEYGPGMFAHGVADVLGYDYERNPEEIDEEELTEEDVDGLVSDRATVENPDDSSDDDDYDELI